MAFIEPCETEEKQGACCVCTQTAGGDDGDGDGAETCGVPWGYHCDADDDCAGGFCCRNLASFTGNFPRSVVQYPTVAHPRVCWDCGGNVNYEQQGGDGTWDLEYCNPCGESEWCDNCGEYSCQDDCTHGFACHWECDQGCECVPWGSYCTSIDDCSEVVWPDYYECENSPLSCTTSQGGSGRELQDTTLGACCQHQWVYDEWVFTGCEEVMHDGCRFGTWWGIHTTCGEFEDCCFQEPDCRVDAHCPDLDGHPQCCSSGGTCVDCVDCECECFGVIYEWDCCEETDGEGIWREEQTCDTCEEECPEERECGPGDPCPSCYHCESGSCVPNCDESSDCPPGKCCDGGCCETCQEECPDPPCPGDQCCVNNSCTYDCPDSDSDSDSDGDGDDGDGDGDSGCGEDGDCPSGQCCEGGVCNPCPPEPGCGNDDDCPDEQCCNDDGECGSCPTGCCFACWSCEGPVPCEHGDDDDDYGMCFICRCLCETPGCCDC